MSRIAEFSAALVTATFIAQSAVLAQGLEVKRYNPSEWTKGRFSEVVTVNGPGKTIYLAGVGAEPPGGLRRRADSGQYLSRHQRARYPGHAARDRLDRRGREQVVGAI
jgi:hypothetical protein